MSIGDMKVEEARRQLDRALESGPGVRNIAQAIGESMNAERISKGLTWEEYLSQELGI